ncbi:hypothetical protein [Plantactinospora endophytica]
MAAEPLTIEAGGTEMWDHDPAAPLWTCTGCGDDWPCVVRRRQLRAEFAGSVVSLRYYLAHHLVNAAEDLRHVPAGWLHNRFIAWTDRAADPPPYTSADILVNSYLLADSHSPDRFGTCPVCGDPGNCWVRLDPNGPGFLIPVP